MFLPSPGCSSEASKVIELEKLIITITWQSWNISNILCCKIGCKSSNKFFICRHETGREKLSDILKHAKNILETREIPLRKERKKKDLSLYIYIVSSMAGKNSQIFWNMLRTYWKRERFHSEKRERKRIYPCIYTLFQLLIKYWLM